MDLSTIILAAILHVLSALSRPLLTARAAFSQTVQSAMLQPAPSASPATLSSTDLAFLFVLTVIIH